MLNVSILLGLLLKPVFNIPTYTDTLAILLNAAWVFILFINDSERIYLREGLRNRLRALLFNFGFLIGIISFSLVILKLTDVSRFLLLGTLVIFFIIKSVAFLLLFRYLGKMRISGRHVSRVLVIGAGRLGQRFFEFTENNRDLGYRIIGFLDDDLRGKDECIKKHVCGKISDLENILKNRHADELIIAVPLVKENLIREIINIADFHGIRIRLIPDFFTLLGKNFRIDNLGSIPVVNVREIPMDNFFNYICKRIFDVLFSLCALILLIPVFLLFAALIKLDTPGPVFYKPIRITQGGKNFKLWKFRSMKNNDNAVTGQKSTVNNDPRITKIGKIIRKLNIDELPQFWNVLKGDMSVVGPRPHRAALNFNLQQVVKGYMIRQYVRPGITGWAQVNGWRGPTETDEQKIERTRHDLWYIENWSLWLDIKIIFLTIFGRNVHKNAF